MNVWDILILALLLAVAAALSYRNRKKGGCSGGCEHCAQRDTCGKK